MNFDKHELVLRQKQASVTTVIFARYFPSACSSDCKVGEH